MARARETSAAAPIVAGRRRAVSSSRASLLLVVVVVVVPLVFGCAHARHPPGVGTEDATLQRRYLLAVRDAAVYTPGELRPLRPLRFDPTTHTATVVALTDYPYAPGEATLPVYLWVTGVPELAERCRGFAGDPALRLRQLLGLPPARPFAHFVVMTVREADVFRPAPDPDPTTVELCPRPPAGCPTGFPADVDPAHARWIADRLLASYVEPASPDPPPGHTGYPWTRLGYTYDWAPGADEYGASEYVIRKGATVTVSAVVPYRDYCRGSR